MCLSGIHMELDIVLAIYEDVLDLTLIGNVRESGKKARSRKG